MNVYQLTQRYPQIVLRESSESGKINVRGGNLVIDIGDYEDYFYSIGLHEIGHFIEVEEDRIFLKNLGMRPVRGALKWRRRTANPEPVRKAAYRELRVFTLTINSRVHSLKSRTHGRRYPSDFEWAYQDFHRRFPEFNRAQLLEHIFEKYKEYSKFYTKDYFFSELERRLELIRG